MSDKLKIYACNGLADGKRLDYQGEGTNAIENTQAMNGMLSYMNLLRTEALGLKYISAEEKASKLNELDLISVAFYFARLYRGQHNELVNAGYAISMIREQGGFSLNNTDMSAHEEYVDQVIASIEELVTTDETKVLENEFVDWWMDNVVEQDKVGAEEISGIGAAGKYGDLNEYFDNAGSYFLYLYIPQSKFFDVTDAMRNKIRKQQEVYNYCKKCFCFENGGIYGTEEDMQNLIRAGIIKDFGEEPEKVAADILAGKSVKSIGIAVEIIVAIISAIVTLITAVIGAVVNYAQVVAVAKYTVPNNPESGVPDPSDFDGLNSNDKKTFAVGAVAIAAAILLINNK